MAPVATVRAKFICDSVEEQGDGFNAKFSAVMDGSEENESFFDATPWGTLEIGTVRDDHFESGKEYYLDFVDPENTPSTEDGNEDLVSELQLLNGKLEVELAEALKTINEEAERQEQRRKTMERKKARKNQ